MEVIDGLAFGHLQELIERAGKGEEIVIAARDRKSGVRLVPVPLTEADFPPQPERIGGQLEGKIWIAPDFDELPEDMARAFGMID